jgi:hypothetical protein
VAVRGDFVVGDEDGVVIIPADKLNALFFLLPRRYSARRAQSSKP